MSGVLQMSNRSVVSKSECWGGATEIAAEMTEMASGIGSVADDPQCQRKIGGRQGSSQIKSVIFDIGKVLVDFSMDRFFALMVEYGAPFASSEEATSALGLLDYERGDLSSDEFFAAVRSCCKAELSRDVMEKTWEEIFTPDRPMIELMKSLRGRYRLGLLSNTSDVHWRYLNREYGLVEHVDFVVPSFQVRSVKPEVGIYIVAEERAEASGGEIVFIDDRPENVEQAVAMHWNGILHKQYEVTVRELERLGILP